MNTESPHDDESSVPAASGKVFLLPASAAPLARELALALARRGHSLALWIESADQSEAMNEETMLELQLEIERAGGISLAEGWPAQEKGSPVAWAVEAFGRIDVALAWGEAGAPGLVRALALLERRAQPRRMVILRAGGERGRAEPLTAEEAGRWGMTPRLARIVRYHLGEDAGDEPGRRRQAGEAAEFLGKE